MTLGDKVSVTINDIDYLGTIITYSSDTQLYGVSVEGLGFVGAFDSSELTFISHGGGGGSDLPDAPTTDGTYTLTATISNGAITYAWISDIAISISDITEIIDTIS